MSKAASSGVLAPHGLRAKSGIVFLLQATAISLVTLLGVYAAAVLLENVLARRALTAETQHYLQRLQSGPAALPDTHDMRGYLRAQGQSDDSIPEALRALSPGFHDLSKAREAFPLVYVTDSLYGRLYLQLHPLGRIGLFVSLVPISLVLLFIYLASFAAYRSNKRAISPVIWLAREVSSWDPKEPDASALAPDRLPPNIDAETRILGEALHTFSERIAELVERERTFTRDASHELRSPLTVIKLACEVLSADTELDAYAERNVRRIQSAAEDMEALVEAFLILARESSLALPDEEFFINAVVRDECDHAKTLLAEKPVTLQLVEHAQLRLHAPNKVVAVIVGNLIRNACTFTERGTVTVTLDAQGFVVQDTGRGMSEEEVEHSHRPFFSARGSARGGQGVGLSIVRRLSDRFGWPVHLASKVNEGTRVSVAFPDAEVLPTPTS